MKHCNFEEVQVSSLSLYDLFLAGDDTDYYIVVKELDYFCGAPCVAAVSLFFSEESSSLPGHVILFAPDFPVMRMGGAVCED